MIYGSKRTCSWPEAITPVSASPRRPTFDDGKLIEILFADFFIDLDHENGPITIHSSLNNVVKYVQAGIQKLRRNVNM